MLTSQVDDIEARYRFAYGAFTRHELADWALLTGTRHSGYDR
jgi:hypothetical protein